MKKRAVLALWALAGLAVAAGGCGKAAPAVGRGVEVMSQQLGQHGLAVFWSAELPLEEKRNEEVHHFYRLSGHLYAVTTENRLLAMDSFSGTFLWSASLGSARMTTTPVSQIGDKVAMIAVLDRLYGFAADSGQRLFSRELSRSPSTRPVAHGEYIYYGTSEGWLDAEHLTDLSRSWDRNTNASILSAPAVDDMQVYFANTGGVVYCSDSRRREVRWRFPGEGQIGPVVAALRRSPSGLILVPSRDYSLYALNPTSGLPAWVCTVGDPLLKPAHPVGNRIYIVKENRVLLALDEAAGEKPLWTKGGVEEFLAASPSAVYVGGVNGKVMALAPEDGATRFEVALEGVDLVAVNDVDGQLFGASRDGRVVCIREAKGVYDDPRARAAEETAP